MDRSSSRRRLGRPMSRCARRFKSVQDCKQVACSCRRRCSRSIITILRRAPRDVPLARSAMLFALQPRRSSARSSPDRFGRVDVVMVRTRLLQGRAFATRPALIDEISLRREAQGRLSACTSASSRCRDGRSRARCTWRSRACATSSHRARRARSHRDACLRADYDILRKDAAQSTRGRAGLLLQTSFRASSTRHSGFARSWPGTFASHTVSGRATPVALRV